MWEIYAYHNSESLAGLFNAIAAVCGGDSFLASLAATVVIGFIAAMIGYAFAPHKLIGWQWLASVMLIYSVLIMPKVTVGIVDKTGGSAVRIVANVPFGLAALKSLSSVIGNTLTEVTETGFQALPGLANLPSEMAYSRNGLVFGNRLIRESSDVVFSDPNFRANMIEFMGNCIAYDVASGYISASQFANSTDIWGLIQSNPPNPARFTPYTENSGAASVVPCDQAFHKLDALMPAQMNPLLARLSQRAHPTLSATAALNVYPSQLQQAYLKYGLADATAAAADIIRQNAMINAVNDTSMISGVRLNDTSKLLLAVGRAQAIQQTNATWLNNGAVAEQSLPVVRNVIEGLVIGLFLLLVLLLMIMGGPEALMALKAYVALIVWTELWPPLFAILNYIALIYTAQDNAAAAALGGTAHGLALTTSDAVTSNVIANTGVVGYLTLSIPFIAWAAVKRMENLGTALMSGFNSLQSGISSTAEALKGQLQMGSVSMDQMALAPSRTSPFWERHQEQASGDTISRQLATGVAATSKLTNQGMGSAVIQFKASQEDVSGARKSLDAALTRTVANVNEHAKSVSTSLFSGSVRTEGQRDSTGIGHSQVSESGAQNQHLTQIVDSVAHETGASKEEVARVAIGAALVSNLKILGAGIEGSLQGSKAWQSSLSERDRQIYQALTSDQISEFGRELQRTSHEANTSQSKGNESRSGTERANRTSDSAQKLKQAAAELGESSQLFSNLSSAFAHSATITLDLAQNPKDSHWFNVLNGPASQAMLRELNTELANFARVPQPANTVGNLPTSREDLQADFEKNSTETGSVAGSGKPSPTRGRPSTATPKPSEASAPASPEPTMDDRKAKINARAATLRAEVATGIEEGKLDQLKKETYLKGASSAGRIVGGIRNTIRPKN
ncbi:conjugal transfer protein TraG [Massilia arenosa]|uniref:Conjugal transfer protein TraG n=1 Tax=Zemynaea arenosa TaxID=2561931 RepID=A0A4Y9S040_9BURK|nr:conjugal transfer protein TraG N-terminal domain-containing protein [Massilia arenosa]TFW13396.1 conjugal transfer protein TraG [Massilia arenosa]